MGEVSADETGRTDPATEHRLRKRLAVDIGGTFVDAVVFDPTTRRVHLEKDFTSADDPGASTYAAIGRLGLEVKDLETFVHGTTLGLNTVLERKGARTGIITNAGFEDIFEIARYMRERERMYSLEYDAAPSLVPRRLRAGVAGRINAGGEELVPLDEEGVRAAARALVEGEGVRSIAICFLHAYRNPDHELRAADIIRTDWPEVSVSVSSEIVREYREYERTATTVVNAAIKPVFRRYIVDLERRLADERFRGTFYITRSGGGVVPVADAIANPVHTIFSGPAGGIIGAEHLARRIERPNLIAVDIGGTSTDACVIHDGAPSLQHEARLEHLPLMIPTFEIATIGAGGGSIARVDGGLLKVGPQSAGAAPGPACYGRGGTEPTFSDAALALGYLAPTSFLGGEVRLDASAATDAIVSRLAEPLGISLTDAARGIFDVLLARTVSAIREITVERGLDPRDFAMLAYGGAGPMFVPLVGRELRVSEIIVPQAPSVFSAFGMLMSDVVQEYAQTLVGLIDHVGLDRIRHEAEILGDLARGDLARAGFASGDQRIETGLELRYFGQEHALEIALEPDDGLDHVRARFDAAHERRYGHRMEDQVQIVNVRVRGIGSSDKPEPLVVAQRESGTATPRATRPAFCFARRETAEFAIFPRDDLMRGDSVHGPAIVEERTTTIVLQSDQAGEVDRYGNLIIRAGEAAA